MNKEIEDYCLGLVKILNDVQIKLKDLPEYKELYCNLREAETKTLRFLGRQKLFDAHCLRLKKKGRRS